MTQKMKKLCRGAGVEVHFEIIIKEALQIVIDNGENVKVGIIEELIGNSDDENVNDEEVIQVAMDKIAIHCLWWVSSLFVLL